MHVRMCSQLEATIKRGEKERERMCTKKGSQIGIDYVPYVDQMFYYYIYMYMNEHSRYNVTMCQSYDPIPLNLHRVSHVIRHSKQSLVLR